MAVAFGCSFTALFVRTPSYDAISEADKLWGSAWESDMAALQVHMAMPRKKVEKGANAQYIQTHIGIGYRRLKNE